MPTKIVHDCAACRCEHHYNEAVVPRCWFSPYIDEWNTIGGIGSPRARWGRHKADFFNFLGAMESVPPSLEFSWVSRLKCALINEIIVTQASWLDRESPSIQMGGEGNRISYFDFLVPLGYRSLFKFGMPAKAWIAGLGMNRSAWGEHELAIWREARDVTVQWIEEWQTQIYPIIEAAKAAFAKNLPGFQVNLYLGETWMQMRATMPALPADIVCDFFVNISDKTCTFSIGTIISRPQLESDRPHQMRIVSQYEDIGSLTQSALSDQDIDTLIWGCIAKVGSRLQDYATTLCMAIGLTRPGYRNPAEQKTSDHEDQDWS